MNKYSLMRVGCAAIITIILQSFGCSIFTWQHWVIYAAAWAMGIIQFIEDNNN
jgi:hypothetical protein